MTTYILLSLLLMEKLRARLDLRKRRFERKFSENIQSDAKSFFKYVRSKTSSSVRADVLHIGLGGKEITVIAEIANAFNQYFASVFTVEDTSTLPALSTLDQSV